MDNEISRRKTLRLTWDDDAIAEEEDAQSPARRARAELYDGPPERFRPRFIQAFAFAGAAIGLVAVVMAFLHNGAWAFLTVLAFLVSLFALKTANEDIQTYGPELPDPYATELRKARTWAIASLGVIGGLLLVLVLALAVRILLFQASAPPA